MRTTLVALGIVRGQDRWGHRLARPDLLPSVFGLTAARGGVALHRGHLAPGSMIEVDLVSPSWGPGRGSITRRGPRRASEAALGMASALLRRRTTPPIPTSRWRPDPECSILARGAPGPQPAPSTGHPVASGVVPLPWGGGSAEPRNAPRPLLRQVRMPPSEWPGSRRLARGQHGAGMSPDG